MAFGALLIQTKKIMCAAHTGRVISGQRGEGGRWGGGADPSNWVDLKLLTKEVLQDATEFRPEASPELSAVLNICCSCCRIIIIITPCPHVCYKVSFPNLIIRSCECHVVHELGLLYESLVYKFLCVLCAGCNLVRTNGAIVFKRKLKSFMWLCFLSHIDKDTSILNCTHGVRAQYKDRFTLWCSYCVLYL